MNPTSLITLPVRLGYEAARRTLDLVVGAGQAVGLFGGSEPEAPNQAPKRPQPRRRSRPKAGMDDATLARKVESEIFRDADAPKGDVSVDVQAGVVYLRGEIADESWIARLGEEAGKVVGIKGVQNLLHTPGTPAPAAEPRGVAQEQLGSS